MFTQGFGEVLTDLLTINPALADLPSASAILDTSNYTFNAITYGKDAQGFNFHGHTVSSTQYVDENSASGVSGLNGVYTSSSGLLIVKSYNPPSENPGSYYFSSTYLEFASTYNSVPEYPSPYNTRLEIESTSTTNASAFQYASALPDLGHYPNAAIDENLSSIWNVIGGFPPEGDSGAELYLFSGNSEFVVSGTLSGVYNEFGLVDSNGFVKINEASGIDNGLSSLTRTQGGALSGGPCVFSGQTEIDVSSGESLLAVVPQLGDAAALAAFGGISHIGVWCLDLKGMLASGLMPPYSWDPLNNNRQYKLVSKVTLWDNLLSHEDPIPGFSGLLIGFGLLSGLANNGPLFVLKFTFT
tara:strand:+ start:211 stop:1281 length:1071 start_codon:yes stop_codon:yes gene_type:complete